MAWVALGATVRDFLIGIGLLMIIGGVLMFAAPVLGLTLGIATIISGVLLIVFARILGAVELTAKQTAVVAAQLRANAGLTSHIERGKKFNIGGFPAVRMPEGADAPVVVRTSVGDIWFADSTEAAQHMPPAPPPPPSDQAAAQAVDNRRRKHR